MLSGLTRKSFEFYTHFDTGKKNAHPTKGTKATVFLYY